MRALVLMTCVLLTSCADERDRNVVYEVNKLDFEKSTLRITYTGEGDRDVQVAPVEVFDRWQSDTVYGIKEGKIVRLTVEAISGNSRYEMRIYRGNGELTSREFHASAGGEVTLAEEL